MDLRDTCMNLECMSESDDVYYVHVSSPLSSIFIYAGWVCSSIKDSNILAKAITYLKKK